MRRSASTATLAALLVVSGVDTRSRSRTSKRLAVVFNKFINPPLSKINVSKI